MGTTTVARFLKETSQPPKPVKTAAAVETTRVVTARCPNHVWHVDLTAVPIGEGFWTAWLPFSLPQRWPFCYWVAVVVDHYSRRAMGCAVYRGKPTSVEVRAFLGRTVRQAGNAPRHLICDQGKQFIGDGFKGWCKQRGIEYRYGAIGEHGSIAMVERFIRTMKQEATRRMVVSHQREQFHKELKLFLGWYNEHRPHTSLAGKTPDEVYHRRRPANRMPRFETRAQWPRPSPCARPRTLVKGQPGVELILDIRDHCGQKHLPVVSLRRAA